MKILRSKSYVLDGQPVPLARVGQCKSMRYDTQKNLKLYASITLQSQHNNEPLFEANPLELLVTFYLEIPKTRAAKVSEEAWHYYRADLDNLVKFVCDCANRIIFRDDSLVCSIIAKKVYSSKPRTEFTIRELKK
jgi:Holliday junction resolvase RusA-like endonuclease